MRKITTITGSLFAAAIIATSSSTAQAATALEIPLASNAALQYLQANQQIDGSISNASGFNVNDWAAIAVLASGQDPSAFAVSGGQSLATYVASEKVGNTSPYTTIERKILALSALGVDSSAEQQLLLDSFDGTQIGDTAGLNDDIFGVMAIAASGNEDLWDAAQASTQFILDNQLSDGSFCWDAACSYGSDTGTTASALAALALSKYLDLGIDVDTAINLGTSFILGMQKQNGPDTGGFGYDGWSEADGSTTAWAVMALNALGTHQTERDAAIEWFINVNQTSNTDGGFMYGPWGMNTSDTSTTSEALIAINGKSWVLNPLSLTAPVVEESEPTVAPDNTSNTKTGGSTNQTTNDEAEATNTPVITYASTPVKTEMAADTGETTDTTTPAKLEAKTTKSVEKEEPNNLVRTIGWSLFVVAILGTAGYVFYIQRRV